MTLAALDRTFGAFIWFLRQCSIVGGEGAIWFWSPVIGVLALLAIAFKRAPVETRKRFWWLAALPAVWTFVGLWGGYFWLDTGKRPIVHNPAWVLWPVQSGLWVFIALAIALILYLKNGRTFAVLFAALNLYPVVGMSFLAGMAVSGVWL